MLEEKSISCENRKLLNLLNYHDCVCCEQNNMDTSKHLKMPPCKNIKLIYASLLVPMTWEFLQGTLLSKSSFRDVTMTIFLKNRAKMPLSFSLDNIEFSCDLKVSNKCVKRKNSITVIRRKPVVWKLKKLLRLIWKQHSLKHAELHRTESNLD